MVNKVKVVLKMSQIPERVRNIFQREGRRKIVPVLEPCDGDRLFEVRVPFLVTMV